MEETITSGKETRIHSCTKGTNESHHFLCEQERLTYSFLCRQDLERPFVTLCFRYHVDDRVELLHSLHSTGTVCMHAFRQTLPLCEGAGTQTRAEEPLPHSITHHGPPVPTTTSSPLIQKNWVQALSNHPDQALANFVLKGIQTGFRIGFNHAHQAARLKSARKNLKSARDNPTVVQEYNDAEVQAGRLVPLPAHIDHNRIHVSPFRVIPKCHQPSKWRLIVDLSSPKGHSVNDGISEPLCSLRYPSVHNGARMTRALGKGALLAKLDLKNVYRIIPVHPDDRWLLGVRWQGQTLLDTALPFGLRSAPKTVSCGLCN